MEVGEADFEAAAGIALLAGGKIVLDKSESEKQAEENELKIAALKRKLADTDYIAAKIAEGSAAVDDYADKIAQRQAWRKEIADLSA
jgi:hypothetical protein